MDRSPKLRRIVSAGLLLVGALALLAAILDVFAWTSIVQPAGLERQVQQARRDPAIQAALANAIVTRVVEHASPDLIAARPLLRQIIAVSIGASPFDPVFRQAARELHRALFEPSRSLVFDVADSGVVISSLLQSYAPGIAKRIPAELQNGTFVLDQGHFVPPFLTSASRVRLFAILVALLAVVCFALSLALARERRLVAIVIGIAFYIDAFLLGVALIVGRRILIAHVATHGSLAAAAAGAMWDIVVTPLWYWIAVLAAVATILVGVASPWNVGALAATTVQRVVARPLTGWGAALRAFGVLGLGLALITRPLEVLRLGLILSGLFAVAWATGELLDLLDPEGRAEPSTTKRAASTRPKANRVGAIAGVAVMLGLMGAGGNELRGSAASTVAASDIKVCNGYAQLCNRPITDVSFAATHNSMSAASEPGWYAAAHDGGILSQLNFGIRGFLIDTHYGVPNARGDRVRTDLSYLGTKRSQLVQELGEPAVAAAERIAAGPLGYTGPADARRPYLCHFLCELGATPFEPALVGIRQWLERNPHEVIVLIIEDAISPEDTARAFADSGLLSLVYTHPAGAPWPTLRHMIALDQRVLVMAEEEGGNSHYPWYNAAFSITQDTAYNVRSIGAFTCAANRGSPGATFFLLNNWVATQPPAVRDAKQVNARNFLLTRAEKCERIRDRLPNFVAVDFYDRGNVLGVVDALNHVPDTGSR